MAYPSTAKIESTSNRTPNLITTARINTKKSILFSLPTPRVFRQQLKSPTLNQMTRADTTQRPLGYQVPVPAKSADRHPCLWHHAPTQQAQWRELLAFVQRKSWVRDEKSWFRQIGECAAASFAFACAGS